MSMFEKKSKSSEVHSAMPHRVMHLVDVAERVPGNPIVNLVRRTMGMHGQTFANVSYSKEFKTRFVHTERVEIQPYTSEDIAQLSSTARFFDRWRDPARLASIGVNIAANAKLIETGAAAARDIAANWPALLIVLSTKTASGLVKALAGKESDYVHLQTAMSTVQFVAGMSMAAMMDGEVRNLGVALAFTAFGRLTQLATQDTPEFVDEMVVGPKQ